MRYLTHLVIHDAGVNPRRVVRDAFGLDASGCWCELLTSPAIPASHALSGRHNHLETPQLDQQRKQQLDKSIDRPLTFHPDFSFERIIHTTRDIREDIELDDFTHSPALSHSHSNGGAAASLPTTPSRAPRPWPTPLPPVHSPPHNSNHNLHHHSRKASPLRDLPQIPPTSSPPSPITPSQQTRISR